MEVTSKRIPEGWTISELGSLGFFFKGGGISMKQTSNVGLPAVMYGDLYIKFHTRFNFADYLIPESVASASKRAQKYDLLFSASGETVEDIGKCVVYEGTEDIYIGGDIIGLRPNEQINSTFLAFVQNAPDAALQKSRLAQGHTVVHIYPRHIKSLTVAHPVDINEQKAIATTLSEIDDLISSLAKLIIKKQQIKNATMRQLLSGDVRLDGFSKEWEQVPLGSLLTYEQPTKYIVKSTDYADTGNVPVLTAGKTHILGYTREINGIYDNLPCILFDDFTTEGRYIDYRFKVKSSATKLLTLRSETENLKYVFLQMQMRTHKPQDHKRHWISEHQHIQIPLPSPEEQEQLVAVIFEMEKEIKALQNKRDKLVSLKTAAMHELLTGNIRLV